MVLTFVAWRTVCVGAPLVVARASPSPLEMLVETRIDRGADVSRRCALNEIVGISCALDVKIGALVEIGKIGRVGVTWIPAGISIDSPISGT